MADESFRNDEDSGDVIRLSRVAKTYPAGKHRRDEVRALAGVDLAVAPEELVVLLGPSGCGKTTLLRSVAGLITPDSGRMLIDGKTVFDRERRIDVPPEKRPLSMVFQSYALWPHMTVLRNVEYPLRSSGMRKRTSRERARTMLEHFGLGELALAYPSQLSGGQQQRVALVRALIDDRQVVLFDEPLSNVDAKVRQQLRLRILETKLEYRFCGFYVTHDQEEAMEVADRIAVMRAGETLQVGTPEEVYSRPASSWVARFIGRADDFAAVVSGAAPDHVVTKFPAGSIHATVRPGGNSDFSVGQRVDVLVRPGRWQIVRAEDADRVPNALEGTCLFSVFKGDGFETRVRVGPAEISVITDRRYSLDDPIVLGVHPDDVMVFPVDAGAES